MNIYPPTAYIHTHTHKMSSTDALTTAGRHLLSFDFTANNDHLHDFEWSASSSSFVLYSPLSFFIRNNFSNVLGTCFSRRRRCERRTRVVRRREFKTTPLRRNNDALLLSLSFDLLCLIASRERERETRLLRNSTSRGREEYSRRKKEYFWLRAPSA